MATATEPALLPAEEFGRTEDSGHPTELVRGRVVSLPIPFLRHGLVCARISFILGTHVHASNLGHLISNGSGVVSARGPDSVRGPDFSFYP